MKEESSILLVEDNEDDVILVQRALRKAGVVIPIHVARDGDEAVSCLEGSGKFLQQPPLLPAFVLLDLKLPRRSGLEVLEWIRAHPTLRSLPVVVFTTSTQDSDVSKAYALGVNSYLKKPAGAQETADLLKTAGLYWTTQNIRPPAVKRA